MLRSAIVVHLRIRTAIRELQKRDGGSSEMSCQVLQSLLRSKAVIKMAICLKYDRPTWE